MMWRVHIPRQFLNTRQPGRSGVAPDGTLWPDMAHGDPWGGNTGAGAGPGPAPLTGLMRHPPRMERMPADVATRLNANRAAAKGGSARDMLVRLEGERAKSEGRVEIDVGGGFVHNPPKGMMDLANAGSTFSEKDL